MTSGHRLCLIYNLCYTGRGPTPPSFPGGEKLEGATGVGVWWHTGKKPALSGAPLSREPAPPLTDAHPERTRPLCAPAEWVRRLVALAQEWGAEAEAPMKLCFVLSHK